MIPGPPITGKTTSILCLARTLLSLAHREAVYMALVRSCMRLRDVLAMFHVYMCQSICTEGWYFHAKIGPP